MISVKRGDAPFIVLSPVCLVNPFFPFALLCYHPVLIKCRAPYGISLVTFHSINCQHRQVNFVLCVQDAGEHGLVANTKDKCITIRTGYQHLASCPSGQTLRPPGLVHESTRKFLRHHEAIPRRETRIGIKPAGDLSRGISV